MESVASHRLTVTCRKPSIYVFRRIFFAGAFVGLAMRSRFETRASISSGVLTRWDAKGGIQIVFFGSAD